MHEQLCWVSRHNWLPPLSSTLPELIKSSIFLIVSVSVMHPGGCKPCGPRRPGARSEELESALTALEGTEICQWIPHPLFKPRRKFQTARRACGFQAASASPPGKADLSASSNCTLSDRRLHLPWGQILHRTWLSGETTTSKSLPLFAGRYRLRYTIAYYSQHNGASRLMVCGCRAAHL